MSRQGLIQGKYRHEDGLWDDMRITANLVVNVPAPPFEPIFAPFLDDGGGSVGTGTYWYDIGQYSFFNVQVPHGWKEGTLIEPHIHWSTDAGGGPGDVAWLLEWVDATPMTGFPPVTSIMTSAPDSVAGPYFHQVVGFPPIDWSVNRLSTILLGRIERVLSAAATPPGGPDYPGLIALLSIDFHIQKNDMGSTAPFVKG